MNITLHIERLVLDGLSFSPVDRLRLQAAIETELTRLLSTRGIDAGFQTSALFPSLRAGEIQIAAGSSPDGIGQQIAGALYEGIGK